MNGFVLSDKSLVQALYSFNEGYQVSRRVLTSSVRTRPFGHGRMRILDFAGSVKWGDRAAQVEKQAV
jgi:hypothetical protein